MTNTETIQVGQPGEGMAYNADGPDVPPIKLGEDGYCGPIPWSLLYPESTSLDVRRLRLIGFTNNPETGEIDRSPEHLNHPPSTEGMFPVFAIVLPLPVVNPASRVGDGFTPRTEES